MSAGGRALLGGAALGMLVSAAMKNLPTANMSLTALRLPVIFISGVFIPARSLPLQLQVISYLTPLTYLVHALREAMISSSIMFAVDIVALLTWIAAF